MFVTSSLLAFLVVSFATAEFIGSQPRFLDLFDLAIASHKVIFDLQPPIFHLIVNFVA